MELQQKMTNNKEEEEEEGEEGEGETEEEEKQQRRSFLLSCLLLPCSQDRCILSVPCSHDELVFLAVMLRFLHCCLLFYIYLLFVSMSSHV